MTRTVSANLQAEYESQAQHHISQATVEQYLPEWTMEIDGSDDSLYAHGHAACVGDNSGTPVLFRVRADGGSLLVAAISGTDLDNPGTWESLWQSTGLTDLNPRENWSQDSGFNFGGSLAVAHVPGSGFRVFRFRSLYSPSTFRLEAIDFDYSGTIGTTQTVLDSITYNDQECASLQVACANNPNEIWWARNEQVEAAIPGTNWNAYEVWGTKIHRHRWNGSTWVNDSTFLYHTHAEAGVMRDNPFKSNSWTGASWSESLAQWGHRHAGGIAVWDLPNNKSVVAAGMTFWRRFGYNTSTQAIHSFMYHKNFWGGWQRNWEIGNADFETGYRLDYDAFARGSTVDDKRILVWSRFSEPSDFQQDWDGQSIPRFNETVYALLSEDGKHISNWQYLGSAETMCSASIVKINGKLFAIGYKEVLSSPLATLLCENDEQDSLELAISGWTADRNNQWGGNISLDVTDADRLFDADTKFKSGNLVRVSLGNPTEQIQVLQGNLDISSPTLNLDARTHKAKFTARTDKALMDTKAEAMDEILPQETLHIAPTDPIKHMSTNAGYWQLAKGTWDNLWFGDQYGMNDKNVYRVLSFPYAWTGGDGGRGDPGDCLNTRPQHKGNWWWQVNWVAHTPMVDGSIQASTRFGAIYNVPDFNIVQRPTGHNTRYRTIGDTAYSNGMLTRTIWNLYNYENSELQNGYPNTVQQQACRTGLICHAPKLGKKYAFVWESNTSSNTTYMSYDLRKTGNPAIDDFLDRVPADWDGYPKPYSASSHTDDTWLAETMDRCDFRGVTLGANRFYLIVSDYNDENPDWEANKEWVHRAVIDAAAPANISPGKPIDMKMQVLGGTIYCYCRPYGLDPSTGAPYQWELALAPYKAGRFGAGRFGILGSGHAGIQWDQWYLFSNVAAKIYQMDNYVDFWNIHLSDCQLDRPMEELLERRIWQGFTPTEFRAKEEATTINVPANTTVDFPDSPVENLCVDFEIALPNNGTQLTDASVQEAGIYVRGVDFNDPDATCIRIGLVGSNTGTGVGGYEYHWVVKRYFENGVEQTDLREYSPSPVPLYAGQRIPVRITARGPVYTVWVAGNYVGHFLDKTQLGVWWGLYAKGGAATFYNLRLPELYEVPGFSIVDVNQRFADAAKQLIGERKIKGVWTHDGTLRLSYFREHDTGPSFESRLKQSSIRFSDRFVSVMRVDGAYAPAVYASEYMLGLGRRYDQVSLPDIYYREFAYLAAKDIVQEYAEEMVQGSFVGTPDLRVDPEDQSDFTVTRQNQNGQHIINGVSVTFNFPKKEASMVLTTRRKVII